MARSELFHTAFVAWIGLAGLAGCERSPDEARVGAPEPQAARAAEAAPEPPNSPHPDPADADDCEGCKSPEELQAGRIEPFVEAACDRNDYGEAFEAFLDLARPFDAEVSDTPRTRAVFAGWLFTAGEHEEAARVLEQVARAPEAALELATVQAILAQAQGDCETAAAHDETAMAILAEHGGTGKTIWIDFPWVAPVEVAALTQFAHAIVTRRCTDEDPVPLFEAAARLDPGFAPALTQMGVVLMEADRLEDAGAAWSRAVAASPTHADARIRLGDLRESECRFEEALELLDEGWTLNPYDRGTAAYNLCFAYTRAGRYDDAARACKAYATAHPHESDADELYMMGNLLILTPEAPAATVEEIDAKACASEAESSDG